MWLFHPQKIELNPTHAPVYFLSLSKQSCPWIFSFSASVSVSSEAVAVDGGAGATACRNQQLSVTGTTCTNAFTIHLHD